MKTQTLLTSLLFAGTLVFVSCGDEITKTYPGTGEGPSTVADIAEADSCTADNSGALVFSEKTQSLYVCNGKKWIDLGVSQGDAPEIPDSLLNVDCSFGKTDGGWLRMVCGGKTVDSVKIEQNGSANGCTMKRLGAGYEVSCGGKVVDTLYSGSAKTAFDLKVVSQRYPRYAEAKFASDAPLLFDTTLTVTVENFRGASKIKTITWFATVQELYFSDFAVVEGNRPYVLDLMQITERPDFRPYGDNQIAFVAAVTTEDGETTVATDTVRIYYPMLDRRDSTFYPVAFIGDDVWMAANLNYGVRVDLGETQRWRATSAGGVDTATPGTVVPVDFVPEKWCPGDDEAQCAKVGALYQWHTAFDMEQWADTTVAQVNDLGDSTVQGICPDGWKIPKLTAWMDLVRVAEGKTMNLIAKEYGGTGLVGWNGTLAGLYMPPEAEAPAPWDQGMALPSDLVAAYWRYGPQWSTGASYIALVDRVFGVMDDPEEMHVDKNYGLALRCVFAGDPCTAFPGSCI